MKTIKSFIPAETLVALGTPWETAKISFTGFGSYARASLSDHTTPRIKGDEWPMPEGYDPNTPGIYFMQPTFTLPDDIANPEGFVPFRALVVLNADRTRPDSVYNRPEAAMIEQMPYVIEKDEGYNQKHLRWRDLKKARIDVRTLHGFILYRVNMEDVELPTAPGTYTLTGAWVGTGSTPLRQGMVENPPQITFVVKAKAQPELIAINTATEKELEALKEISGVGPATVKGIVEARKEKPFTDEQDLQRAKYVGPERAKDIVEFPVKFTD